MITSIPIPFKSPIEIPIFIFWVILLILFDFVSKKIGPFVSECLITGFYTDQNEVVLAVPDQSISNGALLV